MNYHLRVIGNSHNGLHSAFLQNNLKSFARQNPQIEIRVSPRPQKHPLIKGLYINGREKPVCVRNMEPSEILKKANLLKEASGEKLKRTKKPVTSLNESVRGIWSPYHGDLRGV
jgi:large subunit ribosomal protein L43